MRRRGDELFEDLKPEHREALGRLALRAIEGGMLDDLAERYASARIDSPEEASTVVEAHARLVAALGPFRSKFEPGRYENASTLARAIEDSLWFAGFGR